MIGEIGTQKQFFVDWLSIRAGLHWHYFEEEPILTPDEPDGDGSMYAGYGLVPLGKNNVALPCAIYRNTHNVFLPAEPKPYAGGYRWAAWERDRLIAIEAQEEGRFTIVPVIHRGRHLVLNLCTGPAGEVRVQLRDNQGEVIKGRTLSDCGPIKGDQPHAVVSWNGNPDISETAGQPVQAEIYMRAAKLYTFQFEY